MKKLVIGFLEMLGRWLGKLALLLIWPFRHWKFLLLFFTLLFIIGLIIPLVKGVKWTDIPSWYQAKIIYPFMTVVKNNVQNITQTAEQKINQSVDTAKNKMQQIAPNIIKEKTTEKKKEPIRFTAWNVAKFKQAKYQQPQPPQQIAAKEPTYAELKKKVAQNVSENNIMKSQTAQTAASPASQAESYYEGKLADYYTVRHDLDLIYLPESEKLYGQVDVVGPNSLYINDTYVYLYGIYTNPDIYNEQSAQLYLEKLIDNQPVHCDVVAYSIQSQTPTALCFLNGRLINQELVDAQYAANVALK